MPLKTLPFDAAEFLDDEASQIELLNEAFESGDPSIIASTIGLVARARGMTQVAKEAGLGRESLYKALSGKRKPGIDTILRVLKALDIKLVAEPAAHHA